MPHHISDKIKSELLIQCILNRELLLSKEYYTHKLVTKYEKVTKT